MKKQLADVKKQLAKADCARYFDDWVPRKILMDFFYYGYTQIAALFKQGDYYRNWYP